MSNTFTLFEVLISIGITQGLITACLLLLDRARQPSKRILGIAILMFCLVNFRILFYASGLAQMTWLRFIPLGSELLLPPLFYLYAVSLTQPQFKWLKTDFLHLLPGLLILLFDCLLYVISLTASDFQHQKTLIQSMGYNQVNSVEDILIVISSVVYVFMGYRRLFNYRSWLFELKLDHTYPIYSWLSNVMIIMSVFVFLLLVNQSLDSLTMMAPSHVFRWQLFNVIIAFLIYYMGFMGYKQENSKLYQAKLNLETMSKKLAGRNIKDLSNQLDQLFDNQAVHLDPDLSLSQLAQMMNTTAENLSFVFNHNYKMSFRDYINQRRVSAVKHRLDTISDSDFSILDIALDCGFNSQASFYRAFKKFVGKSPKAYLESKH
ncbi:helix-turn-helix domain-containing protein [Marinicella sp. W31]|uniref:helix-turn-helix domain-containing protein n=1 Tax=Marinicella sp. W31 TaxID=3023713 RepID=UPI00375845EC